MKKVIIFGLIIFLSSTFLAQSPHVEVYGNITENNRDLVGVLIQVTQGSKVISSTMTDPNGEYAFQLPLGGEYLAVVSRDGYVSKKFVISTIGVPPEKVDKKFQPIGAAIELFRKMEGVDYSLLNQPMMKFFYNIEEETFEYDKAHQSQMAAGLEQIYAAEKAIRDKEKEKEARYASLVKDGDKAFGKKDWQNAINNYKEALKIKPKEIYPQAQVTNITKIMEDLAIQAKIDAEAKARADKEAADKLAKEKADADAKAKAEAEQKEKDRLAALAKKQADEAAAKAKADAEAAARAKADKELAEKLAKEKADADAKAKLAAELLEKEKAAALAKKQADEAAAKAKADADALAKKQKDEALAKQKADEAAAKAKADKELGEKLAKEKADAEAKAKAEADAKNALAAEQKAKDEKAAAEKLAREKAAADELAAKQAAAAAKEKADKEAADKIAKEKAEAAEKLAKEKTAAADKAAAEALAKKKEQEEKDKKAAEELLAQAKAAQEKADKLAAEKAAADKKALEDAKARNEAEALAKQKADLMAKEKADKAIADALERDKQLAEAKRKADAEKAERDKITADAGKGKGDNAILPTLGSQDSKYKEAVRKGDNFFALKRFLDAKQAYQEALTYKGGDTYASERLLECEKMIGSDFSQIVDVRQKQLLAKYPEGVTEETIPGDGVVIIRRVLVKNKVAYVYEKKLFNWGGTACFRDGNAITELVFDQETKK